MPLHYRHSEDGEKRCYCPWCSWTGTLHETDEYKPDDGRESFQGRTQKTEKIAR